MRAKEASGAQQEVAMLTMSVSRAAELEALRTAQLKVYGGPEYKPIPTNANSIQEMLFPQTQSPLEKARKSLAYIGETQGIDAEAATAASAAQGNIERLGEVVGSYNWALYELTPERLEAARAKMAPEDFDRYRQRRQDDVESCGSSVQSWATQIGQVFQVAGTLFEEQDNGQLRLGQFSLTFAGDGYTARADSSGGTEVSGGAAPVQPSDSPAGGQPLRPVADSRSGSAATSSGAEGSGVFAPDEAADAGAGDAVAAASDTLAAGIAELATQSVARLKNLSAPGAFAGGYTAGGLPGGRSAAQGRGGKPVQVDVCA